MDAVENLKFIQQSIEANQPVDSIEKLDAKNEEELFSMYYKYVKRNNQHTRTFDASEADESIIGSESPYILTADDGSYLYILVYGLESARGLIEYGVSISTHSSVGWYEGGYMYRYVDEQVRRSYQRPDDAGIDQQLLDRKHYSLGDFYRENRELETLLGTDDDEVREYLQAQADLIKQERDFDRIVAEEGYDHLPPHVDELKKVRVLLEQASPFPNYDVTE